MTNSHKINDIQLQYKIWFSGPEGKGIMGDGKWKILKAIQEYGSLKAATDALGITYRRTWGDLKEIEKNLGFTLLEKSRGGKDGGQTQLTEKGVALVQAFDTFHKRIDEPMNQAFAELKSSLDNL